MQRNTDVLVDLYCTLLLCHFAVQLFTLALGLVWWADAVEEKDVCFKKKKKKTRDITLLWLFTSLFRMFFLRAL